MEQMSQQLARAQRIARMLLDEGITPSGPLEETGSYQGLLASLVTEAKEAAKQAARSYVQHHPTAPLLELISAEVPPVPAEPRRVGILLSEVVETPVHWLWKRRLALGKITTLDGDPGLGKSTLTLDVAARVTKGADMPDGTGGVKGGVVIITPEDGLSDTIRPRLRRAGADLSKIVSIGSIETTDAATGITYERPFCLPDDLLLLEAAIVCVEAKLVIIDPVMAILGNRDVYKDNEVRCLLAPVKSLAERHGCSVIIVRHFTKSGGDHALYRGGGSLAFIGLARTGLMVTKDPEQEDRCVLANIKNNLSREAPSLTYRVTSDQEQGDDRPYIVWEGVSIHSTKELLSPVRPGEGRQKILSVLRAHAPELLGPQAIAEECDLEEANVRKTLRRMLEDGQVLSPARGLYTVGTPVPTHPLSL
jgi:hypothetical protein